MAIRVTRSAQASWGGTVSDGGGRLALGSGAYEGSFSLRARVEDVDRATNPEEMIAAAEAGCFTMSLANALSEAGSPPRDLHTTARVRLEQTDAGFRITQIAITTVGDVPGVDGERFAALAREAKDSCPVSLALAGTEITLHAALK